MSNYRSEFLNKISEEKFSEKLLLEYFDGIAFIDMSDGRIFPFSDCLFGKLKYYVDYENYSYYENVQRLVDRLIPHQNREIIKDLLKLENIKDKLDGQEKYNVDFYIMRNIDGDMLYKRICFRYFDRENNIVMFICEDMSAIISSDIDPLTGIYDSTGFHKRVSRWIRENPGRKYRMLRYDIDHFKDINGIYGYDMGNRLLRDCGYHMRRNDTPDSFSGHLNADHFVRFCSEDSPSADEYCNSFAESFAGYDLKIPISVHVGVYDLCEEDCNSYTMSYKALLALQTAKGKFDEPIAYYEKDMMDVEMQQQEFLNEIDGAIENEEFEVWFQPQVNYKTKSIIGAEALIRWRHKEKGLIPPGAFLPVFESSNKIIDLDKYMIHKTCSYMRRWKRLMPDKNIIVSVNLSRIDIQREGFADKLKALVESSNIPLKNIRLEITESAYMDNSEMLIAVVDELRERGFIVEMDDFGSGYSSLNSLKDIEIDILKLDMRFLAGKHDTRRSKIIISSVISMARGLDLPVIAEGVETKEQADMLLDFGCEQMQGYYFSKPVPAEEYEKMLMEAKLPDADRI